MVIAFSKKECINCKKIIKKDEHYFEVKEYLKKKIVSKKYCHKNCQDKYDEVIKLSLETTKMLGNIGKEFVEMNNMVIK